MASEFALTLCLRIEIYSVSDLMLFTLAMASEFVLILTKFDEMSSKLVSMSSKLVSMFSVFVVIS